MICETCDVHGFCEMENEKKEFCLYYLKNPKLITKEEK